MPKRISVVISQGHLDLRTHPTVAPYVEEIRRIVSESSVQAVGLTVGIPNRGEDEPSTAKDELDSLMDQLDSLDL